LEEKRNYLSNIINKMEKGIYKYYTELPTWAKGIIAVAVVGSSIYVAYKVFKKIKEFEDKQDSKDTANASENEYNKLVKKGGTGGVLSFPVGKYITASNSIKLALDGCETIFGEGEAIEAIASVVKKPIDWYFLVKTFDVKSIEGCALGDDKMYALPELLKNQLGGLVPTMGAIPTTSIKILNKYLQKQIGITI
jgi:hypothetical protein